MTTPQTGSVRSTKGIGVAAGVLSAAAYGAMSFAVHLYGDQLPATQITFYRAIFGVVVLGIFAFGDRQLLISRSARTLWFRSAMGAVSILCFTWNLQHTSVGMANVLFGVAPIGVILLGWFFGSERPGWMNFLCLGLVVLGSFIFWSASSKSTNSLVLFVGLIGAVAAASSYTALKLASATWSPLTLTWAMSLVSIPVTILFKKGAWVTLSLRSLGPLLLIASLSAIGQIFLALSYRWTDLSTATAIIPSCMAWGVIMDVSVGATAGTRQLAGCVVYLAGLFPLALRKGSVDNQRSLAAASNVNPNVDLID